MILEAIQQVADRREPLSRSKAREVMTEVLNGNCTAAQIAALLVGLHMKGETIEEIVGFAEAIRAAAAPLNFGEQPATETPLVDTCGTGGDASGTFNISTAAA
ncbi:MAG: anthranilate phosphoribosyltransferase, partial [Acidobacteriales bacterium]|nr:anthranilate phosphoribosyltransferase [Terriglobales bacterium]